MIKENIISNKGIEKAIAVYVFGSSATGKNNALSDIDICLIGKFNEKEKLKIIKNFGEKYDVSFFDELPIWIKIRIFREGKILLVNNQEKLCSIIAVTMHQYEDFKPFMQNQIYRRFGKCMT